VEIESDDSFFDIDIEEDLQRFLRREKRHRGHE
jgi:hypothetical protein